MVVLLPAIEDFRPNFGFAVCEPKVNVFIIPKLVYWSVLPFYFSYFIINKLAAIKIIVNLYKTPVPDMNPNHAKLSPQTVGFSVISKEFLKYKAHSFELFYFSFKSKHIRKIKMVKYKMGLSG